jgi:hypothetical protein
MFQETDTISVSECQDPVIVHDRVHVFDPHGIDITIINDPTLLRLSFNKININVFENTREQAIGPIPTVWIKNTIKLIESDHFWIDDMSDSC